MPPPRSLHADIEAFCAYCDAELGLAPATVRNYRWDLVRFSRLLSKRKGARELVEADARTFVAALHTSGMGRAGIARKIACLRSFGKWLVLMGQHSANPFERVSAPKGARGLPTFLTDAEVDAVIAAAAGPLEHVLVIGLLETGARLGELLGLTVDRVNLAERYIIVIGKGAKQRLLPLTELAAVAFTTLPPAAGDAHRHPPTILHRDGRPISSRRAQRILRSIYQRAGITRTFNRPAHVLRHTFATRLADAGADIQAVQELLGHASVATTMIYRHVSKGRLRGAIDLLQKRRGP